MLITEAGAGSDVGAETTAKKNADGHIPSPVQNIYLGGDHELAENIIHPVRARIEGAPAGTKGISLFLVPKFRVNADGSTGAFNDVVCTGIEHKMGIHGNATCSLTLGGSGQCIGTLLGEENKGMKAMFVMMNEARLLVGMQGYACATTAYMYAVNYAKERIQGANLLKPNEGAVPIIQHPDVRRQLLTMKSYVEAMRTLLYFIGYCNDMIATSEDQAVRDKYQGLIEI
jgi:alkylation response protein AidB-like acyl-CoA dehydrogenase